MRFLRVLCPTDFSYCSEAALTFASTMAAESGATLYIVYVHDGRPVVVPGYGEFGYSPDVVTKELQREREQLDKLKPTRAGVECVRQLLVGEPAQEVLRFAEQQGVDLIVMGTHGRTGLRRALMGSVAEAVVRRARCPVLTVKHPGAAELGVPAGPPRATQEAVS